MRYSNIQISQWEEPVATKKKEPFGGKQAKPFGKKGDDDKDDTKKKPAKKTSRGK